MLLKALHKPYLTFLQRNVAEVLHPYLLATHFDATWYKAWHTWALANFEVIGHLESQGENKTTDIPGNELAAHIVQAVQGSLPSARFCIAHLSLQVSSNPYLCGTKTLYRTLSGC
jgi:hypothetical protein